MVDGWRAAWQSGRELCFAQARWKRVARRTSGIALAGRWRVGSDFPRRSTTWHRTSGATWTRCRSGTHHRDDARVRGAELLARAGAGGGVHVWRGGVGTAARDATAGVRHAVAPRGAARRRAAARPGPT